MKLYKENCFKMRLGIKSTRKQISARLKIAEVDKGEMSFDIP